MEVRKKYVKKKGYIYKRDWRELVRVTNYVEEMNLLYEKIKRLENKNIAQTSRF